MGGEFKEFTVDVNEEVEGPVEFEYDTVDFRFEAKPYSDELKVYVQLYELVDDQRGPELFGGYAKVELPEHTTERKAVSFSNFGYVDEAMLEQQRHCWYKVWIDGTDGVRVVIFT